MVAIPLDCLDQKELIIDGDFTIFYHLSKTLPCEMFSMILHQLARVPQLQASAWWGWRVSQVSCDRHNSRVIHEWLGELENAKWVRYWCDTLQRLTFHWISAYGCVFVWFCNILQPCLSMSDSAIMDIGLCYLSWLTLGSHSPAWLGYLSPDSNSCMMKGRVYPEAKSSTAGLRLVFCAFEKGDDVRS